MTLSTIHSQPQLLDIKCRMANLRPKSVVIVATAKAVQFHGGASAGGGLDNLAKHIENIRLFGLNPVVAINRFTEDKEEDLKQIVHFCDSMGVEAEVAEHYEKGGKGALKLPSELDICAVNVLLVLKLADVV